MRRMLIRRGIGLLMLVIITGCLWANWPQWRGPESNGTAPAARNLLSTTTKSIVILVYA